MNNYPNTAIDIEIGMEESAPYEKLALIYNHVMHHVEYRRWAKYITKIIKKYGVPSPTVLDVGCGTGEFIYEMEKLSLNVDGCDPSEAMLKIAVKKNPSSLFLVSELPTLEQIEKDKYNIFTCLYDTINYLPTNEVLTLALNRVYALLQWDGLFIFDMVSDNLCKNYFNGLNEKEIIDSNFAYHRKSFFDEIQNHQINEFSIYTPQGIFKERHIQKIFPFSLVRKIINEETPFKLIKIFEDFSFFEADNESKRAHFILQK